MSKENKAIPKICCDRYKRHVRTLNAFEKNILKSVKKVVVSKKINSGHEKTFSTGIINCCRGSHVATPKKTTKSDVIFTQNMPSVPAVDYCRNCGDVAETAKSTQSTVKSALNDKRNVCSRNSVKSNNGLIKSKTYKNNLDKKPIQQYYRNENFYQSSHSFHNPENIKKLSLNTITEYPERITNSDSEILYEIHPENGDGDIGLMDPDDYENIRKLKEFRENNYFECHSAKSRIHSKASVTSLDNHKCIYRFYLNDRLFPVPINTDYQENIRCIECALPLESNSNNLNINGLVQAKVKLNGVIQDMLLMLPVKNSLIIKERRKKLLVTDDTESLYFGIIKLDLNGDSIFNSTLPSDSLALRYQKGYRQLSVNENYEYQSVHKDDVIII